MANPANCIEAKIVVLGSQGVGKTTLVHRYVKNAFIPPAQSQTTVGASFLTTRVSDAESGTTIRLQIWDTAGQERFRSISKLYYRGAHAAILCYDVTNMQSFQDMGTWLKELRDMCGHDASNGGMGDMIVHIVGTKSDVVAEHPAKREIPFDRCMEYIAEQLLPTAGTLGSQAKHESEGVRSSPAMHSVSSPVSNRSSGFWGGESTWDCCHEVSSKDGEGIEEVFRVITRKLVEQHAKREEAAQAALQQATKTGGPGMPGYFDLPNGGQGSFRLAAADKRSSWLGGLMTPGGMTNYSFGDEGDAVVEGPRGIRTRRCC
nr:hypothetical protein B0A51_13383 [Rachicladosporium sp. CCFEE 5018]